MRLVISDAHRLFAHSLRAALCEHDDEVEVVAIAEEAEDAVRLTDEYRPDVVLVRVAPPQNHGLEALASLRDAGFTMPIVALAAADTPTHRDRATELGATAFLAGGDLDALIDTLRMVATLADLSELDAQRVTPTAGPLEHELGDLNRVRRRALS